MTAKKTEKTTALKAGSQYLIRTVTHYYVGKLETIYPKELLLSSASWIPDTGRFHDCLKNGVFAELEPYVNEVIVNREAVIDVTEWPHILPTKQK